MKDSDAKISSIQYNLLNLQRMTKSFNYYPFGGLMGESSDAQPYKYNGKELDRHSGLDWYDYGARWYDGIRFSTMDRFAEKYPDLSTTIYEEHVACVRENILRAENGFPLRKYDALYEGTQRPYLPSLITNPKCLVKIIFFTFFFVLLSCSSIEKEIIPFKLERQKLLSREFEMIVPIPYHFQKDNYEEGVIYFYSFVDSAYIIVFQGSMMEFPIDKYSEQKIKMKNQKKISVGVENNKFWRKDIFEEGIRIYYDNVSEKNKKIYDKILDGIKIRFPN